MKFISWISDKVTTRIATIIGGLIVSKVEVEAIHAHAELLDELETKAKRLESSGNPDLAIKLREKANGVRLEKPGQSALEITNYFEDSNIASGSPTPVTQGRIEDAIPPNDSPSPGKRRGRPKKIKEDN